MKIIDNKSILLKDELKKLISSNTKVYLSCNHFTAFALFDILETITSSSMVHALLNYSFDGDDDFRFIQSNEEKPLNLDLDRKFKVNKVMRLIENKFECRKGSVGNQNILLLENEGETTCFMLTPMNMDSVALGTVSSSTPVFINAINDTGNQYLQLFNNAWEGSSKIVNSNIHLLLEKGITNNSGEAIYKYSIREIFSYSTISERADKLEKVGFKDSKIWSMLYNFQKDAVIEAIDKIETFGGCIIADSVGLGKTFEALAVIKYYELRNDRVLVIAPKKLRDNWVTYRLNDKRNILVQDRFNFDVLNHTDLSRETGMSGDINLEMINWGNYDLIVIDESHNFRNNNPSNKRLSRYEKMMRDVIKAGVRTKVLLLSATPVNTRLNDLKNQLAFITETNDQALIREGISSIDLTLKQAQKKF